MGRGCLGMTGLPSSLVGGRDIFRVSSAAYDLRPSARVLAATGERGSARGLDRQLKLARSVLLARYAIPTPSAPRDGVGEPSAGLPTQQSPPAFSPFFSSRQPHMGQQHLVRRTGPARECKFGRRVPSRSVRRARPRFSSLGSSLPAPLGIAGDPVDDGLVLRGWRDHGERGRRAPGRSILDQECGGSRDVAAAGRPNHRACARDSRLWLRHGNPIDRRDEPEIDGADAGIGPRTRTPGAGLCERCDAEPRGGSERVPGDDTVTGGRGHLGRVVDGGRREDLRARVDPAPPGAPSATSPRRVESTDGEGDEREHAETRTVHAPGRTPAP